MEVIVTTVVLLPFILIMIVLVNTVVNAPSSGNGAPSNTYKVFIDEIHEDGNILVKDRFTFHEGVFVYHPNISNLTIGQEVLIYKRNRVWELID